MIVTLSIGDKVYFSEVWTHGCERALEKVRDEGVIIRENLDDGTWVKEIPSENFNRAYEAVFPTIIEKIVREGKDNQYSEAWLNEIPERDYEKLKAHIVALRSSQDTEEREKNTGTN